MEPKLKEGDIVLISSIPYFLSIPKIGHIVAFKKENIILIKRITVVRNSEYSLSGDNLRDSLNLRVNKKEIIGKVIYVITHNNML